MLCYQPIATPQQLQTLQPNYKKEILINLQHAYYCLFINKAIIYHHHHLIIVIQKRFYLSLKLLSVGWMSKEWMKIEYHTNPLQMCTWQEWRFFFLMAPLLTQPIWVIIRIILNCRKRKISVKLVLLEDCQANLIPCCIIITIILEG